MVKRYEPAPNGGMMEREGGKYYHRSDVVDLVRAAKFLIDGAPKKTERIKYYEGIIERFHESI